MSKKVRYTSNGLEVKHGSHYDSRANTMWLAEFIAIMCIIIALVATTILVGSAMIPEWCEFFQSLIPGMMCA
jgi:hypothetical protein